MEKVAICFIIYICDEIAISMCGFVERSEELEASIDF